jgi:hypothetical protein
MPTITRSNAAAFRRPLTRIEPAGPPQAYKTYGVDAPLSTHWRKISCEQAGCRAQQQGFSTTVDESTELGQQQAHYIRNRSGRPCKESTAPGGLTVFNFPPGTQCFTPHQTRRARPPLFVVQGGDWRKYLGRPAVYDRPDQWLDDFSSHLDRIARRR